MNDSQHTHSIEVVVETQIEKYLMLRTDTFFNPFWASFAARKLAGRQILSLKMAQKH